MNQPYEIIISKGNPKGPNISVEAENKSIRIRLNGYKIFNTLANYEAILVALNDRIKEIIKKHLEGQAKDETELWRSNQK
jgi:hypothetical protein